jgi:hypothetical protein
VLSTTDHTEYSISSHNQSAEAAQRIADEEQPQFALGTSLIKLDQLIVDAMT